MNTSSPNDMNIAERVVAPCPPFFKRLHKIGFIFGCVATVILTASVALPAVVVSIAGYLVTASAVAMVVSQCTVDGDKSFDVR